MPAPHQFIWKISSKIQIPPERLAAGTPRPPHTSRPYALCRSQRPPIRMSYAWSPAGYPVRSHCIASQMIHHSLRGIAAHPHGLLRGWAGHTPGLNGLHHCGEQSKPATSTALRPEASSAKAAPMVRASCGRRWHPVQDGQRSGPAQRSRLRIDSSSPSDGSPHPSRSLAALPASNPSLRCTPLMRAWFKAIWTARVPGPSREAVSLPPAYCRC